MTAAQMIQLVLGRLGRFEGNTYLVAQAYLELNLIQEELENGPWLPWFLLTAEVSSTVSASNRSVAYPVDFLREDEEFKVSRYDADEEDYIPLKKDDFHVLESQYGADAGPVMAYSMTDAGLYVFPEPEESTTIKWRYRAKEAVLATGTQTNGWTENCSPLLTAKLQVAMIPYLKRYDLLAAAEQQALEKYHLAVSNDVARREAGRDGYRGDSTGG